MRRRHFALLLAVGAVPFSGSTRARASSPVRIGVLAMRGDSWAHRRFDATATYLSNAVEGYRFEVTPMSLPSSETLVSQDEVEFVVTQPANYATLEYRYGLTRMATMVNQTPNGPFTKFGATLFARADHPDIRSLSDLPGRSLLAVSPRGFGGYLMAKEVLLDHDIDPDEDLDLSFCGFPQDQVVLAVRDGRSDAGTVRAQTLGRMAAAGVIDLDDFRILHEMPADGFPYARSTRLFPEWAFAVARQTDKQLAQRVAVALLDMQSDHPAAMAARNAGWTVPLDYGPVHDLLRKLREPPYEHEGEITWEAIFEQYKFALAGAIAGAALLVAGMLHVARLNTKLRHSNRLLQGEVTERMRVEHQLVASEKMASLGRMAAGIAHELNSPLGFLSSNESELRSYMKEVLRLLTAYAAAEPHLPDDLRAAIESTKSDAQLAYIFEDVPALLEDNLEGLRRMRQVVSDMKSFSHMGDDDWRVVDLRETLRSSVNVIRHSIEARASLDLSLEAVPELSCLASQLGLVFLSLLENAHDAIPKNGTISVRLTHTDEETICVEVEDDGEGIEAEAMRRIFDPFFTTKPIGRGTGLGLSIAHNIVERHGGRLEVDSEIGRGSVFRVILPLNVASRT